MGFDIENGMQAVSNRISLKPTILATSKYEECRLTYIPPRRVTTLLLFF